MVHRAQAKCIQWLHLLRRGRHGLKDGPSEERAKREFHAAVMTYYEQIKRFAHKQHIEREWHEEPILGEQTLDDLRDLRLGDIAEQTTRVNPDTMSRERVAESQPWMLSPREALLVYDQLDTCAHRLGFDAEAKRIAEETGAGFEDVGEMDHINANPLEAGHGDD
jgi:hypothetical protein